MEFVAMHRLHMAGVYIDLLPLFFSSITLDVVRSHFLRYVTGHAENSDPRKQLGILQVLDAGSLVTYGSVLVVQEPMHRLGKFF